MVYYHLSICKAMAAAAGGSLSASMVTCCCPLVSLLRHSCCSLSFLRWIQCQSYCSELSPLRIPQELHMLYVGCYLCVYCLTHHGWQRKFTLAGMIFENKYGEKAPWPCIRFIWAGYSVSLYYFFTMWYTFSDIVLYLTNICCWVPSLCLPGAAVTEVPYAGEKYCLMGHRN